MSFLIFFFVEGKILFSQQLCFLQTYHNKSVFVSNQRKEYIIYQTYSSFKLPKDYYKQQQGKTYAETY